MRTFISIYIYGGGAGGGDQDSKKCWVRDPDGSELPSTDGNGDVLGQTSVK